MDDKLEVLLEIYKSQVHRSEHYESLRSSVINILFVISALLVSIAAFDARFSGVDIWIGATLTVLGIFGYFASYAHGRRSLRHGKRAEEFRNAIDLAVPAAMINETFRKIPREPTRLNLIWNMIPIVVAFLGVVVMLLAIIGPDAGEISAYQ